VVSGHCLFVTSCGNHVNDLKTAADVIGSYFGKVSCVGDNQWLTNRKNNNEAKYSRHD